MFCTDTIGATFCAASSCVDVDLGEPDVADLALLLQRGELTDLILGGELVVDAVQLEQIDGVHTQPAQAHLALLAQIGRKAERVQSSGPVRSSPALVATTTPSVGVQRLADQLLGAHTGRRSRRCR